MRVFDRYQAIEVDLPELVEPGRYRLLRRTVLNGSSELPAGDLLWSDGGILCDLEGEASRTFVGKDGLFRGVPIVGLLASECKFTLRLTNVEIGLMPGSAARDVSTRECLVGNTRGVQAGAGMETAM